VPRGEFSIVLAGIGVAAGVTGDLKSLVVSYVLILAIGGSLLVRFVK
jgi:CPA2 family monovalent cation:H+ antiporter-2